MADLTEQAGPAKAITLRAETGGDQEKTAGDQRRSEIRATIEWPLTTS